MRKTKHGGQESVNEEQEVHGGQIEESGSFGKAFHAGALERIDRHDGRDLSLIHI